MIREEQATRAVYDPAEDSLRAVVQEVAGVRLDDTSVDLLLDAQGYLVGIDLGGEGFARVVVMLGPHEAVHATASVRARVARDPSGNVAHVDVLGAKRAVRGAEPNPYVKAR